MKAAIGWWGATVSWPSNRAGGQRHRRVVPHPQSESSITPETHGREEEHREKEKNTKTGEILVSEERKQTTDNPTLMMSSEWDGKVDSTSLQTTEQCTQDVES